MLDSVNSIFLMIWINRFFLIVSINRILPRSISTWKLGYLRPQLEIQNDQKETESQQEKYMSYVIQFTLYMFVILTRSCPFCFSDKFPGSSSRVNLVEEILFRGSREELVPLSSWQSLSWDEGRFRLYVMTTSLFIIFTFKFCLLS